MCHCLACQRRTGSAFSVQGLYDREHVETAGRFGEYVRVTDAGEPRTYCFCPDCGSTVFFTAPAIPDLVGVPTGAFADPTFPAPEISVHESRRHGWVTVPEPIEHRD